MGKFALVTPAPPQPDTPPRSFPTLPPFVPPTKQEYESDYSYQNRAAQEKLGWLAAAAAASPAWQNAVASVGAAADAVLAPKTEREQKAADRVDRDAEQSRNKSWKAAHQATKDARTNQTAAATAAKTAQRDYERVLADATDGPRPGESEEDAQERQEDAQKSLPTVATRMNTAADDLDAANKAVWNAIIDELKSQGPLQCSEFVAKWCISKVHDLCKGLDCSETECECTLVEDKSGDDWNREVQDPIKIQQDARDAAKERAKGGKSDGDGNAVVRAGQQGDGGEQKEDGGKGGGGHGGGGWFGMNAMAGAVGDAAVVAFGALAGIGEALFDLGQTSIANADKTPPVTPTDVPKPEGPAGRKGGSSVDARNPPVSSVSANAGAAPPTHRKTASPSDGAPDTKHTKAKTERKPTVTPDDSSTTAGDGGSPRERLCTTCEVALNSLKGSLNSDVPTLKQDLDCLWMAAGLTTGPSGKPLTDGLESRHHQIQAALLAIASGGGKEAEAWAKRKMVALIQELASRCASGSVRGPTGVVLQEAPGGTEVPAQGDDDDNRYWSGIRHHRWLRNPTPQNRKLWERVCKHDLPKAQEEKGLRERRDALVKIYSAVANGDGRTITEIRVDAERAGALSAAPADGASVAENVDYLLALLNLYCGRVYAKPKPPTIAPIPEEPPMISTRGFIKYWPWVINQYLPKLTPRANGPKPPIPDIVMDCPTSILIYVHGINTTDDDAERTTATLASRLKAHGYEGVVVGFSWDSVVPGGIKRPKEANFAAQESAANLIAPWLAQAIRDIRTKCRDKGTKIHVLTHSLGARVLLRALGKGPRVDSLQMVSPAISRSSIEPAASREDHDGEFSNASFFDRAGSVHIWYNETDYAMYWFSVQKREDALGRYGSAGHHPNVTESSWGDLIEADHTNYRLHDIPSDKFPPRKSHGGYYESRSVLAGIASRLD